MQTLTVICRESGYENDILIYTVKVSSPIIEAEVKAKVEAERKADLGEEGNEMEILFAFSGDLLPIVDWRD